MTTKRKLTREEEAMADRMKAIIASTPGLTEESVGAFVGVSQGQVSHWTNKRLPVSTKRAPKLAEALGITDPAEISVAYRDTFGSGRPVSSGGESQPVRLDPERVVELVTVMTERWWKSKRVFNLRNLDAANQFAEAYAAYVQMKEQPTPRNVVEFSIILGKGPQGASSHERGADVPTKGTVKRNVGGARGRKA